MSNKVFTVSRKQMSPDQLGKQYGDYYVICLKKYIHKASTYIKVKCAHTEEYVLLSNLKRGKQLGCLNCYYERNNLNHFTSKEDIMIYKRFKVIKNRCSYSSVNGYSNYGGRGIKIYPPWVESPGLFIEYVKNLPGFNIKLTLDRIDNTKGYEPGNLRWASAKEQALNRCTTVFVEYNNEQLCIADFARKYTKLSVNRIGELLKKGKTPEELAKHIPLDRGNRVRYSKCRT
jgi:hypothetical protein